MGKQMNAAHLFSASGYLCSAAEDLRSTGLFTLADEVEALIAVLELELLFRTAPVEDQHS